MMRAINILLFIALLCGIKTDLYAYDEETHARIATRAAEVSVSSLDGFLRFRLGFDSGIGSRFSGSNYNIQQLIAAGARFEDEPDWRVLNHFHNPLQPWDQAG